MNAKERLKQYKLIETLRNEGKTYEYIAKIIGTNPNSVFSKEETFNQIINQYGGRALELI